MTRPVCTETGSHVRRARKFMFLRVDDYRDGCGEINCTGLAEETAHYLDLYENYSDIPEWVFELAFDVAERSK